MAKRPKVSGEEVTGSSQEPLPRGAEAGVARWTNLPDELWQRILALFPQSTLTNFPKQARFRANSRMSLISSQWRLKLWSLLERAYIDCLREAPSSSASIFPAHVSFASLRKLESPASAYLKLLLDNSPRLEQASLQFQELSDAVCLGGHPTLKRLKLTIWKPVDKVKVSNYARAEVLWQPISLQGLAQAAPNLQVFDSSFGYSDGEEVHLRELTQLQELRLHHGSFPAFDLLFTQLNWADLVAGRVNYDPLLAWIRSNLPPIELRRLHLGFFCPRLFFGSYPGFERVSVAVADQVLKLGFVPTAETLIQYLSGLKVHQSKAVGVWELEHLDVAALPFPPKKGQNVFMSALLECEDQPFAIALFNKLFVPYVKHWAPVVAATSPGVKHADIEAYIGSRALLEGAGVHRELYLGHRADLMTYIVGNHQFPLDVNFKYHGIPFCQLLRTPALQKLIERADALGRPIDFSATNPEGDSIATVIRRPTRNSEKDHWVALEAIARYDVAYFLQSPFGWIGRVEEITQWYSYSEPTPEATRRVRAARDGLYQVLMDNYSDSTLSRMEIARHIFGDKDVSDFIKAELPLFITTDAERLECVKLLIFEKEPPRESLAEVFLYAFQTAPHLGPSLLRRIRCQHKGWNKFILPDDIRTPNDAGETPLHHWLATTSERQFWVFALRHSARIDDFSLTNLEGKSLLDLCITRVAKHQAAITQLLRDKNLSATQKDFLTHFRKAIHRPKNT